MQRFVDNLIDVRDHLALDDAILVAADAGQCGESIRLWEMPIHVVVAGRSTRVEQEISVEYCQGQGIEILRRCSGGASVVVGPGCLMYSLVLRLDAHDNLRRIDVAHQYVMSHVLSALRCQLAEAEFNGTSDLTWRGRKCSGNSLRVTRNHLLYHGTLLYDFDLPMISRCLKVAPRQPEYRQGRDHDDFVGNVPIDASQFAEDLCRVLEVDQQIDASPLMTLVARLRRERYDDPRWHFRH